MNMEVNNEDLTAPSKMPEESKHQKIYEATGIEPIYFEGFVDMGAELMLVLVKHEDCIDHQPSPHYPAEQLWEMLPKVIERERVKEYDYGEVTEVERYTLGIDDNRLAYQFYLFSELHGYLDNQSIDIDGDLHKALLDMTLWSIEEGHIKRRD